MTIDDSGTSWWQVPIDLKEEFKTSSKNVISSALRPEFQDCIDFHETIKTGVENFYNFHQASQKLTPIDVRRKRVADVEEHAANLALAIKKLHEWDSNGIRDNDLINTKKHHYGEVDYNYPRSMTSGLEELSIACKMARGDLRGIKQQGPILRLAINLSYAINRYGKSTISSASYSQESVFVNYLDLLLQYLSSDGRFGEEGYIFDRKYKDNLARSLAKSFKHSQN
jgi:hypothetical protein